MNEIRRIKVSDYKTITEDTKEWLDNKEELPSYFWERVKSIDTDLVLKEFCRRVRQELYVIYGNKRDKANTFADSRFTPLEEMIKRGMISCGALTHIFGTVFRKFGIPVKYIHGRLEEQEGNEDRHSWLEVYNPIDNSWFEADPGHPEFGTYPEARRIKAYYNWFELRMDMDYDERNF